MNTKGAPMKSTLKIRRRMARNYTKLLRELAKLDAALHGKR
jgi:hypothetical protein